jgi:hypothetical protein
VEHHRVYDENLREIYNSVNEMQALELENQEVRRAIRRSHLNATALAYHSTDRNYRIFSAFKDDIARKHGLNMNPGDKFDKTFCALIRDDLGESGFGDDFQFFQPNLFFSGNPGRHGPFLDVHWERISKGLEVSRLGETTTTLDRGPTGRTRAHWNLSRTEVDDDDIVTANVGKLQRRYRRERRKGAEGRHNSPHKISRRSRKRPKFQGMVPLPPAPSGRAGSSKRKEDEEVIKQEILRQPKSRKAPRRPIQIKVTEGAHKSSTPQGNQSHTAFSAGASSSSSKHPTKKQKKIDIRVF